MPFQFTTSEYRQRTTIALRKVDRSITSDHGGTDWIQTIIDGHLAWIYAQLSKRYRTPFDSASTPEILKVWLTRLTDLDVWLHIYSDPNGSSDTAIYQRRVESTEREVAAAANGETGIFEFIVNDKTQITRGGPISYSKASTQLELRQHAQRARAEERNALGTVGGRVDESALCVIYGDPKV
jgi:hypothetical protein